MKTRILSLMLAAAMLTSLLVPAHAAETDSIPLSDFTVQDFEDALAASYGLVNELNAPNVAAAELSLAASGVQITADGGEIAGTAVAASPHSDGKYWLIMPAGSDPSALSLKLTISGISVPFTASGAKGTINVTPGDTIDLNALCGIQPDTGYYKLAMAYNGSRVDVNIRFSENVAALYLTSADPIYHGRAWVEASPDKSNKATGSAVLQNPDGTVVYSGELTQIKGRGNSTWGMDKKPYQIKLASKCDLLGTGNKKNANKTWVLLANAYDSTLLHNAVTFDLARSLGMEVGIEYRYVDLYYDSE